MYEDHCRVVIENETKSDWDGLVVRLKEAFLSYPSEVGWNLLSGVGARRPSTSGQGNLLEALNVTLNLLQYHFYDRDLHRTGNSIVIVSAGNGVFEVDKKLAQITYQRMMDNGIGSDMLSLGLPPLHVAPFFLYFNDVQEVESEIPHWIHLSFISYESNESLISLNDAENEKEKQSTEQLPSGATKDNTRRDDMPEVEEEKSDTTRKPVSPHRTTVATPTGKSNKERHLEDRDIRDILEACRPRATGILPPSLKSLLEMYKAGETLEQSTIALSEKNEDEDLNIREWGGIDLDEVNNRRPLPFTLDKRGQPMPDAPDSPPAVVEVERLESATQPSSFGSTIPHFLLGSSYERHFFPRHPSPGTARLQRAFSMDSMHGLATEGSQENEEDDTTFLRFISQSMQMHDRTKMMRFVKSPLSAAKHPDVDLGIHDVVFAKNQRQTPTIHREQTAIGSSVFSPVTVHHATPSGASQMGISGIGAALSHYFSSINKSRDVTDLDKTGSLSRSFEVPRTIPHSSSVGHVTSHLVKKSNVAPKSLSPLLLPPAVSSFSVFGEFPFISHVGPYSNERRFIRAKDLPLALRDDQQNSASGIVVEGGSFSTPPESIIHSEIVPSCRKSEIERNPSRKTSSSEQVVVRVMQQSGTASNQFATTKYLQRTNLCSNPTRPASPTSDLRTERNSQQSGSVGENLSVEKLRRRRASLSPSRKRSYVTPSSGTTLARTSTGSQLRLGPGQRNDSPGPVTRTRARNGSAGPQMGTRIRSTSANSSGMTRDYSGGSSIKQHGTTRRRKPINPFRQQDEYEVLAQKSHNSRRWSHVFPQGEIEFKRMSGPNWKSLAAPATLPLSIDYFPPRRERELNFTFSMYNVTLSEFERNNFSSNKELLMEMVRQRITQDYQLVPSYLVDDSDNERRRRLVRKDGEDASSDDIRMYLSLGHQLQVLHYDPNSDTVEVKTYLSKDAQGNNDSIFKYFYNIYCKETNSFVRMTQDFKQFLSPYHWNKVDRIICGDEDREMREGMRFKRLMFSILPDRHSDVDSENTYVDKFKKLLEYFEKLRGKEEEEKPLHVTIVTALNRPNDKKGQGQAGVVSTLGIAGNSMVRFYVPFRKGGQGQLQYLEVAIDSTFNTSWSYRIIFNWVRTQMEVQVHSSLILSNVPILSAGGEFWQSRHSSSATPKKMHPVPTQSDNIFRSFCLKDAVLEPFQSPYNMHYTRATKCCDFR